MDDIQRALAAAWTKIRPRLARDQDELRRRLLRRRQALLQTPPRAWCLALRANDTRIGDATRVRVDPASLPAPHDTRLASEAAKSLADRGADPRDPSPCHGSTVFD